jgi:quinol monooxygenase YgiN
MRLHLAGYLICPTMAVADTVSTLLSAHLAATRAEPGCVRFEVFRSHEDPTRFAVSGVFRDRAALEAHNQRRRGSVWFHGTLGLRRDYRISEG